MTASLRKPTRGPEQRAIGHGVAVRQRFSAFGWCDRLRDGEPRSLREAAGAGVGRSRSRHRPPSEWIIESSPVPPDERRVAGGRLTRVSISTHPTAKWPAAGAHIVGGPLREPSRHRAALRRSASDLDRVQNCLARIPIHYEGGDASSSFEWTTQMTRNAPLGHEPRCTVRTCPSLDSRHRQPVDLVVETLPVMTPTVAAVLARILRSLRELQEGEETT